MKIYEKNYLEDMVVSKLNRRLVLGYDRFLQILISILLVYEGWYIPKYSAIPYILQLLTIMIVGLTFIKYGFQLFKSPMMNNTMLCWMLFTIFSAIGLVVSDYPGYGLNHLFTFICFVVVIYCAGVVNSKLPHDSNWLRNTILIIGVLSTISTVFWGFEYRNGLYTVTTMSQNDNPNGLSFMMTLALYFLLVKKRDNRHKLACMVLALLFCYVILNTGSRSGLLNCCLVLFFYVISEYMKKSSSRRRQLTRKISLTICILISIILIAKYLSDNIQSNVALLRISEQLNFESKSIDGRGNLYSAAWKLFCDNPIFGIGYDCFAVAGGFGYYSHSTYMELLACTGIVGFILFIAPYIKSLILSVKQIRKEYKLFILLLLFALSGLFSIWFYNLVSLMILYIHVYKEN